ncbi:MAG: peptidoglycan DD-metalloendopeptidase family protein [Lachnospiraceae bacterium]|nr:peptidoglycan DD-metalloendopeptidase family protein [Lachnospiraceae bacterium]
MKERVNQLFKDKLILVMMVLGLLTIVAAAGVITLQRRNTEESPYLNMEGGPEHLVDGQKEESLPDAGHSNAAKEGTEAAKSQELADAGKETTAAQTKPAETKAKENAGKENAVKETQAAKPKETEAEPAGAGMDAASALVLNFAQTQSMMWPVEGNVLLDYSMDSTIYFPTLEQYKCNSGIVIQGEVSQPVAAPANARVLETGVNEEIGNYLILDLGDEYSLICGQLKEVSAVTGEYLEKGQIMGYVAEPTKYYTVEGPNVFMELRKGEQAMDPLDYLE